MILLFHPGAWIPDSMANLVWLFSEKHSSKSTADTMAPGMSFQLLFHFHKTFKSVGGFTIPAMPGILVTVLSCIL